MVAQGPEDLFDLDAHLLCSRPESGRTFCRLADVLYALSGKLDVADKGRNQQLLSKGHSRSIIYDVSLPPSLGAGAPTSFVVNGPSVPPVPHAAPTWASRIAANFVGTFLLKTDGSLIVSGDLGIGKAEPTSTLHVERSQSVRRTAVAGGYVITDAAYYMSRTIPYGFLVTTLAGSSTGKLTR